MPSVAVISIKIFVANAEAKTFTRLLANKIVQINCSLSLKIFSKIPAFFLPDLASICIRGFEADVKDVSDPEKNADKKTSPTIEPMRTDKGNSITYFNSFFKKFNNIFSSFKKSLTGAPISLMRISLILPSLTFLSNFICLRNCFGEILIL